MKAKKRIDKKKEIKEAYRNGDLSVSDTVAYELLKVLDRNRQNTSTIVTIIAINLVLMIISAIAIVIASN